MWEKLIEVPYKVVGRVKEFLKIIKNDERGLSGVVVAILLILVAVLAIVLIWGFLSGWLQELWEQITSGASAIR
jgi:Flp pilus assembly pilin Flp